MFWTILVVFMLLALVAVFLRVLERRPSGKLPYQMRSALFSNGERAFLSVLDEALGPAYRVFGKVRVADLVEVRGGPSRSEWGRAFGKIKAKHFDFVICRKNELSVFCVVELDDASHARKKSRRRDEFIDDLCKSVGLRLVRVKAQRAYKLEEIHQLLAPSTTR